MFLVTVVFALLSVQSTPLVAGEPEEVSGTLSPVSGEEVYTRTAGKNMISQYLNVWEIHGSLEGQLISEPRVMVLASGEVIVLEWCTIECTWNDLDGTIKVRNIGGMTEPGVFHLDSTIVRGTGVFAGLYGSGYVDIDQSGEEIVATYWFDLYWEEED